MTHTLHTCPHRAQWTALVTNTDPCLVPAPMVLDTWLLHHPPLLSPDRSLLLGCAHALPNRSSSNNEEDDEGILMSWSRIAPAATNEISLHVTPTGLIQAAVAASADHGAFVVPIAGIPVLALARSSPDAILLARILATAMRDAAEKRGTAVPFADAPVLDLGITDPPPQYRNAGRAWLPLELGACRVIAAPAMHHHHHNETLHLRVVPLDCSRTVALVDLCPTVAADATESRQASATADDTSQTIGQWISATATSLAHWIKAAVVWVVRAADQAVQCWSALVLAWFPKAHLITLSST
ncbi:hypothetical protein BC828DRAFT_387375 [Blastocladiella britannica]|nr:hypothetical protein BC828DRAFT_387375 [Blastocladiella britannica]